MKIISILICLTCLTAFADLSDASLSCKFLTLRLRFPNLFTHCEKTCIYNSWSGWSYTGIRNRVPESKCTSNSTLKYVRMRTASNESLQKNLCTQQEQTQERYDCEPTLREKAIIIIQRLGLGADADKLSSTTTQPTQSTTRSIPTGGPTTRPTTSLNLRPNGRPAKRPNGRPATRPAIRFSQPLTLNCTNPSCSRRRSAEREHFPRYVRQSPDYRTCPTSTQQSSNQVCRNTCTSPQTGKRSIQDEEIAAQSQYIVKWEELDPLVPVNRFNLDAFLQQTESTLKRKKRCSGSKIRYVLFVLDTSGSIGPENFEKVKDVVAGISRKLCEYLKVAVITYDNWINLEFCFNCYDTRSKISDAINRIQYRHGPQTHTTDAIKCACDILRTKCNLPEGINTPNIDVVVLTDGRHNGPCQSKLSQEIKCLKTDKNGEKLDNIKTYAIGIGTINIEAVAQLRQNPDEGYIFDVPDFDELKGMFDVIKILLSQTVTAPNGEEVPEYSCYGHLGPCP